MNPPVQQIYPNKNIKKKQKRVSINSTKRRIWSEMAI
jgi:hypothetical protein